MKTSYLIDTDWVIDHFNKIVRITQKLKEFKPDGVALSVISLAELYEGVYYSKDPIKSQKVLNAFLKDFQVLGVDAEICKVFGKERGRLRHQRKIVSDFDLLIASTCLHYDLTLLTNNRRHYEMVEGLKIFSFS
ncbi:MAG: type II toxin-antitoxin system VapC family toxin [Proteobacteria bacterium]|nr:type II toxin-antitoxin system VapC family toxin [Pseudomonadota bacterium]